MKHWLIRAGAVVLTLFLLLMLAALLQAVVAQAKLKTVMAALERDGIPTSWSAYYKQFPDFERHLAAQSNLLVALDRLAAAPKLSDERFKILPIEGSAELPEPDVPLPPAMTAAIESRLREVSSALDAVRRAVSEEPFWLVASTNLPDMLSFPHLGEIRQVARLFEMEAILEAEKGNSERAMDAVRDGLRLAEVPHRGSVIIDELVRFACEWVALSSLEVVLAKTDLSQRRLQEVDSLLFSHDDIRTGLYGELIFSKQMYGFMARATPRDLRVQIADCGWPYAFARPPFSSGWLKMNEAYYLDLLHKVIRLWDLPWDEFQSRCNAMRRDIPKLYSLARAEEVLFPSLKRTELNARGRWACGRLAIAIRRYVQAEGKLPDSLSDLKPRFMADIPSEPFHGHAFTYVKTGDKAEISFPYPDSDDRFKFRVYARGRNAESTPVAP